MFITVRPNRQELICPYCATPSTKVHSCYPRKFSDLPIQGKKVTIIIENRKMFCQNPDCGHKTFAEKFCFYRKMQSGRVD
ncbi:MAG: transposase family protein [Syntrophomonadaceae bacterium]|nr:transposase family protein [Syntrophomonadaceae bacterium]